MRLLLLAFLLLAASAVQAQGTQDPNASNSDPAALMQRLRPGWKPPLVSQEMLARYPLGSRDRPVRAHGPDGEHAYLRRLRCENNAAPSYRRAAYTRFASPYGFPMDIYEFKCGELVIKVYMDMYHKGFVEQEPVPGLKLLEGD